MRSRRVPLLDYVAACDRATGTTVLRGLIDRHVVNAQPVDLAALWRELGVSMVRRPHRARRLGARRAMAQDDRDGSARSSSEAASSCRGNHDRGVWLEDLTWPEAKARFDANAVVVIPVGAAAKAHGPHLPLKTDALTARALGQRLIERLPVVAAPVVGFGFYPAFTAFAGSQHLSGRHVQGADARSHRQSARPRRPPHRLINTGVSTEKPLDELDDCASCSTCACWAAPPSP